MASLLHDLLVDLRRRAIYVLSELERLGEGLPSTFKPHHANVTERIKRAVTVVEGTLTDPDLSNSDLEPNFFIVFKRLTELILNVEDYSLLILNRCSEDDQFLSAVLQRICAEVGYGDGPPLCSALSFQYFQAVIGMDIIMTPQTQPYELLSLPDLYHELAHFVVFRKRHEFEVTALTLIHRYFNDAFRKGQQQGLPQASLDLIRRSHLLWAGDWQVEFVCDMIASFWCGPAYGWANLRLSATRGDPYQEVSTHPADDGRRVAIGFMLNLVGEGKAVQNIDSRWDELKRLSPSAPPPGYTRRYPARLLEELAASVYQACVSSGFRSFKEQKQKRGIVTVGQTVDDAWNLFSIDATSFSQSEGPALQKLRDFCGGGF